ncbi:MAG: glycosyltransferase family 61 protein [Planctomycetota bacterium]
MQIKREVRRGMRRLLGFVRSYPEQTTFAAELAPAASAGPPSEASAAGSGRYTLVHRGDSFPCRASKYSIDPETFGRAHEVRTEDVFVAGIPNGRLVSDQFIVTSAAGKIFADSAITKRQLAHSDAPFRRRWPAARCLEGAHVVLASRYWENYYHWLFDIVSRLSLIEQFDDLRELPLLVPKGLKGFQLESLDLFGVDRKRLVEIDGSPVQVEWLVYPSLPRPLATPNPWVVFWLREKLLAAAGPPSRPPYRRLYITRRDSALRKLLNEDEIEGRLHKLGFETVCCSDFGLLQQVELFRDAEIVVGPHGAGFSNMLFAPTTAPMLEINSPSWLQPALQQLSSMLGQPHGWLLGAPVGEGIRADADQFERMVCTALDDLTRDHSSS